MTNVLNRRTITIDAEGIISLVPITIRKASFSNINAAGDKAIFVFWDENDTVVQTKAGVTTTVTASSATFASTSNFPTATINPDLQIIKFTYSATGENLYTGQIATNADNNTITLDAINSYHGTLTNDTNEAYSWNVWNSHIAFTLLSPGTEKVAWEVDFGPNGYWFPNLAMRTLTASATIELLVA